MAARLDNPVLNRGFNQVANLLPGQIGPIAGWEAGIRGLLNAEPDNVRYITKSNCCVGLEEAVTIYGLLVPQQEKRHHFIKAKNIDTSYTFFIEFLVPNVPAIKGDIQQPAAELRVLREIYGVLVQNGALNPNMNEVYRARPALGADTRSVVMQNFDVHFQDLLASRDNQGAFTPLANMQAFVTALKDVYFSEELNLRMRPFMMNAFEVAIALSKMGSMTDDKHSKITEQIRSEKQISLKLTVEDYSVLWRIISLECKRHNMPIPGILKALHSMIRIDDDLRINLTLSQSSDAGVAGVIIVGEAFKAFPSSRLWRYAMKELSAEYHNWIIAARMVATNAYIGYGARDQTELVKSTRFPNLYYLAKKVMSELGGDKNVARIKTSTVVTKKAQIDGLVDKEKTRMTDELSLDDYKWEEGYNVFNMAQDMEHILNSI